MHRLKSGQVRAIRLSLLEALCQALACTPADLLAYVPASSSHGPLPGDAPQQAVLDALGHGPTHPDDVGTATGLRAQEVSVALLALELADLVVKTGPLYRRR